ncbi:MAG: ABC transporter substrate-binding protein [Casimicrobium sp.]
MNVSVLSTFWWRWFTFGIAVFAASLTSAKDIVVGQTLPLSAAPAESLRASRVQQGTLAYFNAINAKGGIRGRKFVLQTLDDKGNSERAKENITALIADEKISALFNMVGGGTCVFASQATERAGVPLFGCMAGSPQLRRGAAWTANVRPGHDEEYKTMAKQAVSMGVERVAFVHDDSETGRLHLENARVAMDARGIRLVHHVAINRTSAAKEVAAQILRTQAQLIFNQGPNGFFAELVHEVRQIDRKVFFMSVCSGADTLVNLLGPEARGVMFTQVVPFPFVKDIRFPIVEQYQRDLRAAYPQAQFSYDGFEAYLNAVLLVAALEKTVGNPSRADVLRAIRTLSAREFGAMRIDMTKSGTNASIYTEMVMASMNKERPFIK